MGESPQNTTNPEQSSTGRQRNRRARGSTRNGGGSKAAGTVPDGSGSGTRLQTTNTADPSVNLLTREPNSNSHARTQQRSHALDPSAAEFTPYAPTVRRVARASTPMSGSTSANIVPDSRNASESRFAHRSGQSQTNGNSTRNRNRNRNANTSRHSNIESSAAKKEKEIDSMSVASASTAFTEGDQTLSLNERMAHALRKSTYECMVCYDVVRHKDAIWVSLGSFLSSPLWMIYRQLVCSLVQRVVLPSFTRSAFEYGHLLRLLKPQPPVKISWPITGGPSGDAPVVSSSTRKHRTHPAFVENQINPHITLLLGRQCPLRHILVEMFVEKIENVRTSVWKSVIRVLAKNAT
ncbi:hypothetical protein HDU78_008543 [Chytriomyces hyalinus]|nr:hypothetical protein HDU78_008543 [Chytriomyces hyalinus]